MHVKLEHITDLDGEMLLCAAILARVAKDVRSRDSRIRQPALAFWRGHRSSLHWWSEALGLEPAVLRRFAGIPNE